MLKLLALAAALTALTPEEKTAIAAAEINQEHLAKTAAAEINKKVWILSTPTSRSEVTRTAKAKPKIVEQIVTAYRQPETHTHTCANKHTWDHRENDGHVCTAWVERNGKIERCGLTQTVQDSRKQTVTMTRKVASTVANAESAKAEVPSLVRQIETRPVSFVESYVMPARVGSGASGCANGQCSYPQTRGWR